MSGEDFQEEAVLAAVKPLKSSADYGDSPDSVVKRPKIAEAKSLLSGFGTSDHDGSAIGTVESLFQQHNQRVFRTAYRVTGSAADAEDVLQTVFLRVARGQEAAAAAENTEAYLSRAAVNASLDLLRSRKRSKAVAIDDLEGEASVARFVAARNPETHHEDRELRKLIREAVAKLGDTAGQMFALRYFEGYGNSLIFTGRDCRDFGNAALDDGTVDSDIPTELQMVEGGEIVAVDDLELALLQVDGFDFDRFDDFFILG
jgi:RNA polymerase sigma-70 factor (ECF subfamily)